MCEVVKHGDILTCKRSGMPIVMKTPYGMFCAKECDIDATLFSKSRAEQWMDDMPPIFEQLKEKK